MAFFSIFWRPADATYFSSGVSQNFGVQKKTPKRALGQTLNLTNFSRGQESRGPDSILFGPCESRGARLMDITCNGWGPSRNRKVLGPRQFPPLTKYHQHLYALYNPQGKERVHRFKDTWSSNDNLYGGLHSGDILIGEW